MITKEKLQEFVTANPKLVQRKESARYPGLFVVKYKRNVFWDNLWNDVLVECRGLVVDSDWNIVIQPFTKIFNRGENGTDIDRDTDVVSIRKVNGFMAAATYVQGYGVVVSTTGSLDSDFVTLAEKWITAEVKDVIKHYLHGITYIFEIVDPADPHIIVEEPGAYLLGARQLPDSGDYMSNAEHEAWLDNQATLLGVLRPEWTTSRFSDVVDAAKSCQHEGFVVYSKDQALKIKSPYYLTSKFLARKSEDKLLRGLNDTQWFRTVVDEEYYPVIDYLVTIKDEFVSLTEQERLAVVQAFIEGKY